MGIPNLIMVRYGQAPWPPDRQQVLPYRSLREVVWSVVGEGGTHHREATDRVLQLPQQLPNMTGVMMDDFFRQKEGGRDSNALSLAELGALRGRLTVAGRQLQIWVVLYDHQLELPVREYLELCDTVTYWTWKAEDLQHLESNFARMESLVPQKCRKVLGCYMWDYGRLQPMPVAAMQRQCETGLRWLREGRIAGMIFLASCICDLELETVEWTRRWIAEVGDKEL